MGTNLLSDMRSDLYLLLGSRDEVDPTTAPGQARLDRFLNWCYLRIQLPSTFEHVERQTSEILTLVTSTTSYSIAVWAIDHIRYDNFSKLLRPMSKTQLSNSTVPAGQPSRFARWGQFISLDYSPTTTQNGHTLTVYGWIQPSALTNSVSVAASSLNSVWDEVIVAGAAWRGWRSLGDSVRADTFREEYSALVNDNRSVLSFEGRIEGWRASYGSTQDYQ
jgi:hypothetical protein